MDGHGLKVSECVWSEVNGSNRQQHVDSRYRMATPQHDNVAIMRHQMMLTGKSCPAQEIDEWRILVLLGIPPSNRISIIAAVNIRLDPGSAVLLSASQQFWLHGLGFRSSASLPPSSWPSARHRGLEWRVCHACELAGASLPRQSWKLTRDGSLPVLM